MQREYSRRGRGVSFADCVIRPILQGGGVAVVAERSGRPWTVEAYLWLERNSLVKHEYVDGTVYALAGGTRAHSRIAMNAGRLLEEALDESPRRVCNSAIKVRVS